MIRAQKFTPTSKQIEHYSDFLPNLELNPITAQLARATNENAVSMALKNLCLTMTGERFYHPEIGSKIHGLNFEMDSPTTADLIKTTVKNTIESNEPRAQIKDIIIKSDPDNNSINIQVVYGLVNIQGTFTVLFPVRVR